MKLDNFKMPVRVWLRKNGYEDIAALIEKVMTEFSRRKSKERRNWWDILSGTSKGASRSVRGYNFPVLQAAQQRQGKPVTVNAISRHPEEAAPKILSTNRWPKEIKR